MKLNRSNYKQPEFSMRWHRQTPTIAVFVCTLSLIMLFVGCKTQPVVKQGPPPPIAAPPVAKVESVVTLPKQVLYLPMFLFGSNWTTTTNWFLEASTNLQDWFFYSTNQYMIIGNDLWVTNSHPQMFFRLYE
jgi:hypothetical protein